MAIVKYIDGKDEVVEPIVAANAWKVLSGEIEGTEEQQEYCLRIKKIYMNWRNPETPDSYIEANKEVIFPMVKSEWMIEGRKDQNGKIASITRPLRVTRPDPTNIVNFEFSKKWKLL